MKAIELCEQFGESVRRRRESLGLSQEALAEACDLHRTHISLIERGLRDPKLSTLQSLARGLETTISALVKALS